MTFIKKWLVRLILFIIFIGVLLAASDNSQPVALSFISFHTGEWPVAWWVITAFVIGVLFGSVLNFATNTRLRVTARRATKELEKSHREVDKTKAAV